MAVGGDLERLLDSRGDGEGVREVVSGAAGHERQLRRGTTRRQQAVDGLVDGPVTPHEDDELGASLRGLLCKLCGMPRRIADERLTA